MDTPEEKIKAAWIQAPWRSPYEWLRDPVQVGYAPVDAPVCPTPDEPVLEEIELVHFTLGFDYVIRGKLGDTEIPLIGMRKRPWTGQWNYFAIHSLSS